MIQVRSDDAQEYEAVRIGWVWWVYLAMAIRQKFRRKNAGHMRACAQCDSASGTKNVSLPHFLCIRDGFVGPFTCNREFGSRQGEGRVEVSQKKNSPPSQPGYVGFGCL